MERVGTPGMTIKNKQQGFTIVELLIVIVVIGILAALVITTFTGIQQKARNTERETDVKALHSQIEAYYAQNGYYPDINNVTTTDLKGLDADALLPPNSTTGINATAATIDSYAYIAAPSGCTTAAGDCTSYQLTAVVEGGGGNIVKDSLN